MDQEARTAVVLNMTGKPEDDALFVRLVSVLVAYHQLTNRAPADEWIIRAGKFLIGTELDFCAGSDSWPVKGALAILADRGFFNKETSEVTPDGWEMVADDELVDKARAALTQVHPWTLLDGLVPITTGRPCS